MRKLLLLPLPLAWLLTASSPAAQLGVAAVHPDPNAVSASTATDLVVTFDAALDPASVTPASFRVFGRWSGARAGDLSVAGNVATWRPTRAFFPGEHVQVEISSAVRSAGGDALERGFAWTFWTRAGAGTGDVALEGTLSTRLPGEGLIQSYGIYAGDLDQDGAPDFSIPNEVAHDVRVMRNDGCGAYTAPEVHPLPAGSVPSANDAGDFDGDGALDLAVANIGGDTSSVLLGDGAGSYAPATTIASGDAPRGVAAFDLDADGDTDFAVTLRGQSRVALHAGDGAGAFAAPVLIEAGVAGETSIAQADANQDGVLDLFVGGYDSQEVAVLAGDGAAGFATTDVQACNGRPWMLAAGDVDGDGDADAATCNSNTSSAGVLRGDGAGGLAQVETYASGSFPLAVDLGDVDGDGDLDLVISSYGAGTWTYRRNDGAGGFAEVETLAATFAGSCMSLVDDDRDGDLDLIGLDEVDDRIFFYRQTAPPVPGVQPGACAARLRVNERAGLAGFSAVPPHPLVIGERVFLGLSTAPGAPWAIAYGPPLVPGAPTALGLLNLLPPHVLVAGVADAFGEGRATLALPPGVAPGASATLQGASLADGLSNPETFIVAP